MRRAIVAALNHAAKAGRDAAEIEDLLAVIAADRESAGAYVLEQCGIDLATFTNGKPQNANPAIANSTSNENAPPVRRAPRLADSCLRILKLADREATRLLHSHVGTEHVIAAISQADDLAAGQRLNAAGATPERTLAAIHSWIAEGMPRRRAGWGWRPPQSGFLGKLLRPIQKAARIPPMAWNIFARKSLGHPGFVSNPYPLYAWLRQREPVRRDPLAPVWILTRYDDVADMLRNSKFLKDPFGPERLPRLAREQLSVGDEESRVESESVSMLFLDPPRHTRVRGVFARAFTPASLAELRPRIELIARKRIDRIFNTGRLDIIADLAYPLPVVVIAEMLGFPPEDYQRIKVWSDRLAAGLSLRQTPAQQAAAARTWDEMRVYFDEVVQRTQSRRENSLLARLLESENEPDALSRAEIFTNCVLLLSAGHETTTNLIGNAMLALLKNRPQWDALVQNPQLIDAAVEEALRFDSPVQWTSRLAGEPIVIAGKTIPPGEVVLGCVGAANRDPAKFPHPDRFDIHRPENRHLSFGTGIHFCLGAALARMEAAVAISEMARRLPKMRLQTRRVKWIKGLTFRGAQALHASF
jgi:cytochrome P450